MSRPLDISTGLQELIRPFPPKLKARIRNSLETIARDPRSGKPLVENLQGFRNYKVGRFRVVYRDHGEKIQIVGIGPRETIYEKVAIELKKEIGGKIKPK